MQETTLAPFPTDATFDALDALVDESYGTAFAKGWHDDDNPASFGDRIALVHSELSEALEEFRNGHALDETYYAEGLPASQWPAATEGADDFVAHRKPEGVPAELADVLIRVFDMCGRYDIPIAAAVREKLAFNRTRPYRHGGKAL